jgi:hypothetical protein
MSKSRYRGEGGLCDKPTVARPIIPPSSTSHLGLATKIVLHFPSLGSTQEVNGERTSPLGAQPHDATTRSSALSPARANAVVRLTTPIAGWQSWMLPRISSSLLVMALSGSEQRTDPLTSQRHGVSTCFALILAGICSMVKKRLPSS